MDKLDEEIKKSNKGFFNHVFNFNDDSKEEMMNIIQYSLLAIIPIIILNKSMQMFIPEANYEKGSIEILIEIISQIILIFIGLLIINRIITYFPTYSGTKYADFNLTNIILAVLLIILSLQTKLGEKIGILVDRCMEVWEGSTEEKKDTKKKYKKDSKKNESHPINQTSNLALNSNSTSLDMLPPPQSISNNNLQNSQNSQNLPNYETNSNENNVPTNSFENFSPMAANEALGGSGFGGANW